MKSSIRVVVRITRAYRAIASWSPGCMVFLIIFASALFGNDTDPGQDEARRIQVESLEMKLPYSDQLFLDNLRSPGMTARVFILVRTSRHWSFAGWTIPRLTLPAFGACWTALGD